MSESKDASVLSRWSRRKHQASQSSADTQTIEPERHERLATHDLELDEQLDLPSTVDEAKPDVAQAVETATAEQDTLDEPLLSDEDMPALSTLNSQSDVSMFFNKGVSAALRRAALKTIFGLPQYNIRDGLNDYDEDYTVFEPLGDTVTCDMKFHQERKEREEREALEREAAEQDRVEEEAQVNEESEAPAEDEALAQDEAQDSAENEDTATDNPDESDQPLDDDNTQHLHASSDTDLNATTEKHTDV